MELRKTKTRKKTSEFLKPIIQIPTDQRKYFIVSNEIINMLQMDPKTQSLMFRYSKGVLTAFLEEKSCENYNLSKYHEHTHRFLSKDLYQYFKDIFPKTNKIIMKNDLTFKKL